jgi:hypothetical protein
VDEERYITINQITNNKNYYLQSPDGEKSIIIPIPDNQNYMIKLTNLKTPGLYKVLSGNDTFSIIPVNIKTQDLFEPFVELDEIENKFEFVKIFPEGVVFEETIVKARLGSELWKLIIFLALVLLGVELLVIKLMEGKHLKDN